LNDSVNAGVSGLLSLRTKWSAGASYTSGAIGFGGAGYSDYSASSRLDFALIRNLGLYGQYAYYAYTIPAGSSTIDMLSNLSRHTVLAGLSLWIPMINDVRQQKPK
jgi:hypothetical protein